MELLQGVITAIASVILTLTGLLRFYLPYHDRKLHNPWVEKLLNEMQSMRHENAEHHVWEKAQIEETRRTLERLEAKLP